MKNAPVAEGNVFRGMSLSNEDVKKFVEEVIKNGYTPKSNVDSWSTSPKVAERFVQNSEVGVMMICDNADAKEIEYATSVGSEHEALVLGKPEFQVKKAMEFVNEDGKKIYYLIMKRKQKGAK